jgi:Protein of unknown function (DUF2742)
MTIAAPSGGDCDQPDQLNRNPSRYDIASCEVCCSAVYLHVASTLIEAGDWPLCGSPAWVALDDADLAKQASLAYAALQWVLQHDIAQDAEREASQAISAAENWGDLGRAIRAHREVYITRRP